MKKNTLLLILTFGFTVLATSGRVPAGLVFVANLFLTAALIFLFGRLPLKAALGWVFLLTVVAGWMGGGWTAGTFYLALIFLPAAAAGLGVVKQLSYGRLFLVLACSAFVPTALFVAFAFEATSLRLLSVGEAVKQDMAGLLAAFSSPAQIQQLQAGFQSNLDILIHVLPALIFMSNVVFLALAHILAIWALGRAGVFAPGPKKFIIWQAPFFLIFLLGLGLAGHLFLQNGWVRAADNLLLIVVFTYAICGTSNLEYFFKKLRTHWAIKGLFYIWLVLFGLVSFFILSAVGFLDSRFDFRGLKKIFWAKESEE